MPERVIVAMSGGVDSSVAAALLHEQGYEVLGITLQLWGKDVCTSAGSRLCCSVRDALDAKAVARRLGIPHETLELVEAFRTHVIDYFVEGYRRGLTPNPCIACNDHIKFGALMERADAMEASLVATGHYARAKQDDAAGRTVLRRAADPSKDQSYVLFNLTQPQLARARFPLGELTKPQVREIARSLGFATAEKPDSQDICFVRDRDKNGFLRRELAVGDPSTRTTASGRGLARDSAPRAKKQVPRALPVGLHEPGPIMDTSGQILGTHRGLLGYTIGQREGLGLATGSPLYVVAMDQPNNRLVIGPREALLSRTLVAERVNWVSIAPPRQPVQAQVKIRSRHEAAAATLMPEAEERACVEFDAPQQAITPGQAAVFYDGDLVLGGGWIAKA